MNEKETGTPRTLGNATRIRDFVLPAWMRSKSRYGEKVSPQEFVKRASVVDVNGCWIWNRAINSRGYGCVFIGSRSVQAHRLSYMAHNGNIPNKMLVCHACDVKSCVNPDHLFLGTDRDNLVDSYKKQRRGKINEKQHAQILAMTRRGIGQKEIGLFFGISKASVHYWQNRGNT